MGVVRGVLGGDCPGIRTGSPRWGCPGKSGLEVLWEVRVQNQTLAGSLNDDQWKMEVRWPNITRRLEEEEEEEE